MLVFYLRGFKNVRRNYVRGMVLEILLYLIDCNPAVCIDPV